MIMHAFVLVADHLIETMISVLFLALCVRYITFRSGQRDTIYFKTFSRSLEKILEAEDRIKKVENVEAWFTDILSKVSGLLPDRAVRFGQPTGAPAQSTFRFQGKESLADFAEGKKSILHGVKQQIDVFKSPYPPNFSELTGRILNQDRKWGTVMGVSVDTVTRVLDILPGLFVVGGIFGTFIGIADGLPKIGAIDLSRINESAPVLTAFIDSVALSMRCSISGILCSVIMTILNSLFPIGTSRYEVSKSLEHCFELVWYRIHGSNISDADRRIIELLTSIDQNLKLKTDKVDNSFLSAS